MGNYLIIYWARIGSDIHEDEDQVELLNEQAQLIGSYFLQHLGGNEAADASSETISVLQSDEFIDDLLYHLRALSEESLDSRQIYNDIVKTICKSRQGVFGDILPFTFKDALWVMDQLVRGWDFWLAYISAFSPEYFWWESNPLWVFPPAFEPQERNERNRRTDRRAVRRFETYRSALETRIPRMATTFRALTR